MQHAIKAKPLHMQLREALSKKIANGEWKPGDVIPTEAELAKIFGLSPGTVRRSLSWMEETGLIARKQGLGTFVLDASGDSQVGRYLRLRCAGGESLDSTWIGLETSEGPASAAEQAALMIEASVHVIRASRICLHQGVPYSCETMVYPLSLFPVAPESRQEVPTLSALAKKYGVLLGSGEEKLRPEIASEEVARNLRCEVGAPVLSFERVVYTLDGVAAQWKRGHMHVRDGYYSSMLAATV